jgi:riboflavin synthase
MFTGLVEAVGEIASLAPMPAGNTRIRVETALGGELATGDSLAVNGVCLTVVAADKAGVVADVSPETARVTTLGDARPGTIVNLERPLRVDGRFGGHFVQGHVDATAAVDQIREDGDSRWLTVDFPAELAGYIVRKGSIAVDGVSLTVAAVEDHRFGVQVIPYTWAHTNFHALKAGDAVNLECDVLAKYVARALGRD